MHRQFLDRSTEVLSKHNDENEDDKKKQHDVRTMSFTLVDWMRAYEEKDSELRLVAEIGQTLLEKSRLDEQTILELRDIKQKREAEIDILKENYADIKIKNKTLVDQLRLAEEFNNSMMQELKQNERKSVQHKVNQFIVEQNKQLLDQVEEQKEQLEKKQQLELTMKQQILELERKIKTMEENRQAPKEYPTLSRNAQTTAQIMLLSEEVAVKAKELEELSQKYEKKCAQLNETEMVKQSTEKQNETLIKVHDELRFKLDDKTAEVYQLRKMIEELQLANAKGMMIQGNAKGSLFDELEGHLEREKEKMARKLTRKNSTLHRPGATRAASSIYVNAATEEYFYLTCSALKINIAFKYQHEDMRIFKLKDDALLEEAKREKIPFHEWHKWLEEKFLKELNISDLALSKGESQELLRSLSASSSASNSPAIGVPSPQIGTPKKDPKKLEKQDSKESKRMSWFGMRPRRNTVHTP